MARDAELKVKITAEDKATASMNSFTQGLKKNINTFAKYVLIYQAGFAALNAFTKAVKDAGSSVLDFEKALAKSSTIAGQFGNNMTQAEQTIKSLSQKFGTDAVDATEAFYNTLSAGFKENPLEIIKASQQGAIAGNVDMKTSTEALTAAMNIFGEEAKDLTGVNDIFFNMVDQGRLTMDQIPDALGKAGETASNMGVKFKDLAGVLAASTKTTNNLNKSSTQVRSALTAMLKPGTDMAIVFRSLGVKSGKELIKTQGGILGAFQAVRTASDTLGLSLGDVLGRKEALNGILSLTGENLERTASVMESVGNNSGTTAAAVAKMSETMDHKIKVATARGMALGRAFLGPIMKAVLSFTKTFTEGFDKAFGSLIDFELAFTTIGRTIVLFGKVVQKVFTIIGKNIGNFAGAIVTALRKAFSGDFKGAFEEITNITSKQIETVNEELLDLGKTIDETLSTKKVKLAVDAPGATKAFTEAGKKIATNINKNIVVDPQAIKKMGKDAAKGLRDLFNTFKRGAGAKEAGAIENLAPEIKERLSAQFAELTRRVSVVLTASSKKVKENKEQAFNELKDAIVLAQFQMKQAIEEANRQQEIMLKKAGAISGAFANVSSAMSGLATEAGRFNAALGKTLDFASKILNIVSQIKAMEQAITEYKEAQNRRDTLGKIGAVGSMFAGGLGLATSFLGLFHNGGAIQKLHNGGVPNSLAPGEVPIIAQTGEYMLSRKAVQNMGGTQAVDDMHRNAQAGGAGGGTNVNLNLAFDTDNFRSFMTGTEEGRDIVKQAIIGAFPT